jgi:hypothetical protein
VSGPRDVVAAGAIEPGPALAQLAELELAAAVAERFAAGWTPGDSPEGDAVWVPPERLRRDADRMAPGEAAWLEARGWEFGANLPENRAEAMLDEGWEPTFADGAWWWTKDNHHSAYARRPLPAEQLAAVATHWPDWLPTDTRGEY